MTDSLETGRHELGHTGAQRLLQTADENHVHSPLANGQIQIECQGQGQSLAYWLTAFLPSGTQGSHIWDPCCGAPSLSALAFRSLLAGQATQCVLSVGTTTLPPSCHTFLTPTTSGWGTASARVYTRGGRVCVQLRAMSVNAEVLESGR